MNELLFALTALTSAWRVTIHAGSMPGRSYQYTGASRRNRAHDSHG